MEENLETTTNMMEAYNDRLKMVCERNYLGIAELNNTKENVKKHIVDDGAPLPKMRKADKEKFANLGRLHDRHENGKMSREDYLYGIKVNIQNFS